MRELFRAAFVIARRDFAAVIFSKAFIFFLLGPLFPVIVGVLAGHLGDDMAGAGMRPAVGVLMAPEEIQSLYRANARLMDQLGPLSMPVLKQGGPGVSPQAMLQRREDSVLAVLSGTLERPILTGREAEIRRLEGDLSLLVSTARAGEALPVTRLQNRIVEDSRGAREQAQMLTGRGTQVLLFLLTMLLAGMVLSNMVEEKTNKIIEILAAAVPVDAIFIGKLIAMLGMSLVGIAIWGSGAGLVYLGVFGLSSSPPPPAVGWPAFIALGILYFAMAYMLLGALFISIGAQASTVREVQTLSMPVTMGQVVVFFLASYAVSRPGSLFEIAAAAFPLSSPFAMIARAAQSPELWPHFLALGWQLLWVGIIIRIGVRLFRHTVLKSGRGDGEKRGWRAWLSHRPSPVQM